MAKIVAGFASSHTPLMSLPGQEWPKRAEDDKKNRELIRPRDGAHVTYEELLESADPKIQEQLNEQEFIRKYENIQRNLDELQRCFAKANPDVVVMIGDDQDEMLFDDNYPMISVYWGETLIHYPRTIAPSPNASEAMRIAALVYGAETIEYPIEKGLGLHVVESLVDQDFDVAQSRYMKEEYGGTIGPATWYLNYQRSRKPRKQGMAHAFSFPICRWFDGKRPPAVPITINTCYPPNWISPRRAYNLGKAVRRAIESWDSDARVAIITSGGLSHFTVDEEIDRLAIKGLTEADGEILSTLPRWKLQSATTEILNWVTAAGALEGTPMTLMMYEPSYRSPAGTGCGCAVGRWEPE